MPMTKETYPEITEKCFCCDRKLGKFPKLVDTRDGQIVYIGKRCWQSVQEAGSQGYQPALGGPKLYPLSSYQRKTDPPCFT